MKSMSFQQGQDRHIIQTTGGYSHILPQSSDRDSDGTDKNPRGHKLQDVLEGMIDRGGRVLHTDQNAKLRNTVFEFVDVW